jgi:hypothetical protein
VRAGAISKTQLIDKLTILVRVGFIEIFALRVNCVTESFLRIGKACKELRLIVAITKYLLGILLLAFVVFQFWRVAVGLRISKANINLNFQTFRLVFPTHNFSISLRIVAETKYGHIDWPSSNI